ncbi:MAG: TonB-dependent receptor, partial [Acidobacteria bacterium]|nr:TonB-dependent receptor [Acidobacteriota bacterium]
MSKNSVCERGGLRISGWTGRGLVLFLFLFYASLAVAQLTRGTISGTVTDQTGGAVPGAAITITHVDTGVTRASETGARGRYEAPSLPAGNYEVRASLAGFQTSIRAGITVIIGRTAVVDHVLQVGEVAQTVTVTGEATFVETTSATVSQVVEQQKVEDLPLPGRDMMELTFLQPGVLRIPQRNDQRAMSGMGEKMTVGGARGQQNNFLLDGVSNNDLSGNPQGASGAYLGAETIQEFQIITNNYSAEYRSQAGAIVSAITKSGTNTMHGSGFWTLRNDNFDAARWEDNAFGGGKPEFKRNQFGGSLGGPIISDRTFFFGSYEGLRERLDRTDVFRLLDDDAHRGIVDGEQFDIDPDIMPYLRLFPLAGNDFPLAPGGPFIPGTVRVTGQDKQPTTDDFVAFKMDHQISDNHSLTGTYNYNDSLRQPISALGGLGQGAPEGISSNKHVVSTGLTSIISPTTLNELKIGYSFSKIANDLPGITNDFSGLQFHPAENRLMGEVSIDDVTSIGFENLASFYTTKGITIKDGLSVTRGNHSLRLGVEIVRAGFNQVSCSSGCNGLFDFSDVADFLENKPSDIEMYAEGRDTPPRSFKQLNFGAYFQDNWQVLPSLTLNLGLRYEFVTVPKEDDDQIANLVNYSDIYVSVPTAIAAKFPNDEFAGTIDDFYTNATKKSFSPRIGFAWAPGDRKTSLRGGVGIFYDHPRLYNIRTTLQELVPFSVVGEGSDGDIEDFYDDIGKPRELRMFHQNAAGQFPSSFYTEYLESAPNIRHMEFDQKNGTFYRWSLILQREVSDWVLSAGYTGSRALHLWVQNVSNIRKWSGWPNNPAPGERKQWCLVDDDGNDNCGIDDGKRAKRISTRLGEVRTQSPNGNSFYHGLALGANKRLSRGLQVQMAYNFSKAIDNGAGVGNNTENLPQGIRGFYYWDMYAKRGLSAQDIRNSFVSNFTYELPRGDFGGFGSAILNGWKINGIITLIDGSPLNIVDDSRASRDYIGDRSNQLVNLKPGGNNNPVLGTPSQGHEFYYDPTQFLPSVCQAGVYCYENTGEVDSRGVPVFVPDSRGRRRPEPLPELGYL